MGKKNVEKKFNLSNEYKNSWNYIKKIRNFIYMSIGIFLLFAIIGFFIPAPDYISEYIKNYIQQLMLETKGMSLLDLIFFIFFNNAKASFFGFILGSFLGIIPVVFLISNGYLLGFVSSVVVRSEGASILLRLLPHGFFELPAVFISLGMGLRLGSVFFNKKERKHFKEIFLNSLRIFLFVVLPLLIIAAIIEGSLISFLK